MKVESKEILKILAVPLIFPARLWLECKDKLFLNRLNCLPQQKY